MNQFPPNVNPSPTTTVGYAYTYDKANRLTYGNFYFNLQGLWDRQFPMV